MSPHHWNRDNEEEEAQRLKETVWNGPSRRGSTGNQPWHAERPRESTSPYYRSPDGRARQTMEHDPFDYSSPHRRGDVRPYPTSETTFAPFTFDQRMTQRSPNRPISSSGGVISRRFSALGSPSAEHPPQSLRHMEEQLHSSSFREKNDLEMARRMQDLEDRGMGRLNSDRELIELDDTPKESAAVHRKPNDFEALAKLISESGTNMDELSDEVLNELLGSAGTGGKKLPSQIAAAVPENNLSSLPIPSAIPSPSSDLQLDPDVPAKSAPLSPVPALEKLRLEDPPKQPPSSQALESDKKVKRRGLFGFQVTTRSRLNLRDVMQEPPTTDYVHDQGGETHSPTRPKARSMSPPPRPGVPSPVPPQPSASFSLPHRTPSFSGGIPGAIPPKPAAPGGIPSHSFRGMYRGTNVCAACGLSHGTFLKVLNRRYHPECFRCSSCNGKIDPNDQFKYTTDEQGRLHSYHRECFLCFGVQCCVCQDKIAVTPDGRVPFIKHPFFDNELMCVRHADESLRRCCGCQRLEPYDTPFLDCMDGDRCVCASCCRFLVVDSADATPLWHSVLSFLDRTLHWPIWTPLRELPILMVGSDALREQARRSASSSFRSMGLGLKDETGALVALVCLTGLPRALVAGILAHEAVHAWMHWHPHTAGWPLPSAVEDGLCQLVTSLFWSEGRLPPHEDAAVETKLRQYYQFGLERDKSDAFRRAALAYRAIGMDALLAHVWECRDFPDV